MTATTKTTAADRRAAAVNALVRDIVGTDGTRAIVETAADIVERIAALRPLGRTDRWTAALDRWTLMVTEQGDAEVTDPREMDLHWAVVQGSTYAQHAAD